MAAEVFCKRAGRGLPLCVCVCVCVCVWSDKAVWPRDLKPPKRQLGVSVSNDKVPLRGFDFKREARRITTDGRPVGGWLRVAVSVVSLYINI